MSDPTPNPRVSFKNVGRCDWCHTRFDVRACPICRKFTCVDCLRDYGKDGCHHARAIIKSTGWNT